MVRSRRGALATVVKQVEQVQQNTIASKNLTKDMYVVSSSPSPSSANDASSPSTKSPSPKPLTKSSPSPAATASTGKELEASTGFRLAVELNAILVVVALLCAHFVV